MGILVGVEPTGQRLRRWLAGFEAAAAADRAELRATEVNPTRSIALSLTMIEAVRNLRRPPGYEAIRQSDDEAVRQVWRRLRERLLLGR
jgi:hypothetical protein